METEIIKEKIAAVQTPLLLPDVIVEVRSESERFFIQAKSDIISYPDDATADIVIEAADKDWPLFLAGDINPTLAFITGRLRVKGDLALAKRIASVLSSRRL